MLKILIVDDEPPARVRLKQVLEQCSRKLPLTLVGEAASGRAALELVDAVQPDVVLLDIHMPGMNGIEVARHLLARAQPPAIVFLTAFDKHALEAFEVHALDYLLKPVSAERLGTTLARWQRMAPNAAAVEQAAHSLGHRRTQLTVTERGRLLLIPVEDIIYLRAELKYVTIRTIGHEHLTEESLSSLEHEFGEHFVRIHRNALVACRSIRGFQRVRGSIDDEGDAGEGHWEVMLRDVPERLPVSRRQWPLVKAAATDLAAGATA